MMLESFVKTVPDFPKKGILFRDISPLLANAEALRLAARELVKPHDLSQIDVFVGIESRGFILAALLAGVHGKGFVPLRKAGKLPPPVYAERYALEYGEAELEIASGSGRALIVDDVLATGGTLKAAMNLCRRAGYHVQGCSVLINLRELNSMTQIHAVLTY